MKVLTIIQARMGSQRLPGKVMMDLNGKPVVQHVIDRIKKVPLAGTIYLAHPEGDDELRNIALASGIKSFGGDEHDVLGRYYALAETEKPELIMRITADCPLIDPVICNSILVLAMRTKAYYTSNVPDKLRTFPKGLDCEVFTWHALAMAAGNAREGYDREHVTPWIRRHAKHQERLFCPDDLSEFNWCIDTEGNLEFMRELLKVVPEDAGMAEIVMALRARPELKSACSNFVA